MGRESGLCCEATIIETNPGGSPAKGVLLEGILGGIVSAVFSGDPTAIAVTYRPCSVT